MVLPRERQRIAQPLTGGSPLREDDGGDGTPPASTSAPRAAVQALARHSRAPLPTPRTRTRRSGSRPKRRSKGAREAFAVRRKRSRADFATTQSPGWFHQGNDPASQNLLSFSRSARESHRWFHQGSDDVLPCPCVGDPRFARMTVERATLPRPLLGVCPSIGDSTGFAL